MRQEALKAEKERESTERERRKHGNKIYGGGGSCVRELQPRHSSHQRGESRGDDEMSLAQLTSTASRK